MRKYIKAVLLSAMLIMTFLVAGCGDTYVNQVREGYTDRYPDITVGEAFDSFFQNGQWESYESARGKRIVEFRGQARYDGEPADVIINFMILEKGFRAEAMQINNETVDESVGFYLLDKIFSDYEAKRQAAKERAMIEEKTEKIIPGCDPEDYAINLQNIEVPYSECTAYERGNGGKSTGKKVYAHRDAVAVYKDTSSSEPLFYIEPGFYYEYINIYQYRASSKRHRIHVGSEFNDGYVSAGNCMLLDEDEIVGFVKVTATKAPIYEYADDDVRYILGGAEKGSCYRLVGKHYSYNYHTYYGVLLNDGTIGFFKEDDVEEVN